MHIREGHLEARPEFGCCGNFQWRVEEVVLPDVELITQRLAEEDFQARCRSDILLTFRSEEGHEIVIVPKTSRIQLRVYFLTPKKDRIPAVRILLQKLSTAVALELSRG